MSSPQHEPTMEEILASIRKIISEDARKPRRRLSPQPLPPPEAAKQELLATPAEPDIEILELTQEVVEAPPPEPIAMAEPPKPDDIVFETVESVTPGRAGVG